MANDPLPELDMDAPSPKTDSTPQTAKPEQDARTRRSARRPGLPTWTLGLLVLALTAALVWAGNAYIRSRQQRRDQTDLAIPRATSTRQAARTPTATEPPAPSPRPTATPPAPAGADSTLILVADLHPADRTEALYEALVSAIEQDAPFETDQVRIERLGQPVNDAQSARAAGLEGGADYVLWSRDTGQGAEPSLQRVGRTTRTHASPEGSQLTLVEPEGLALCALDDVPGGRDPALYAILAAAAYDQAQYDAAATYWSRSIDAADELAGCTTDAGTHVYWGNALAYSGDTGAALQAFDAALELDRGLALAYANRGSVHATMGDEAGALEDLGQALDVDPEIANAHYARATVYRAQDQPEAALDDLDRALELDPEHGRAYASRGLIRHNAGDHEAALSDYDRALALEPNAADVYLNRGGTHATLGRFEDALADYDRALALNPDDADAHYNRGTVHAMLEQYELALADLDRALELKPGFAQVYGNRGLVYKALGNTEQAIADLERFLEISDNPEWRAIIEQQLAELQGE